MLMPPRSVEEKSTVVAELPPLHSEELANGLRLEFFDRSNRYFGDYHRVCVEVRTTLPLDVPALGHLDADLRRRAEGYFGSALRVVRLRERMGVESARVEEALRELIDGVRQEAARYLSRPDYPAKLLTVEVEKREGPGTSTPL